MPLTLTITSAGKEAPGLQRSKVFETRGGTIGRTQGNDWVLPDPERFISGRHARIEYREGMYYLGDTSTNGVFVNGSSQAVGAGNFVALGDGDRLLIGDYEISVRVEGGEMPAPDPFAPGMADDGDEALAITSPTIPPEVSSEQKPQAIPEDPFAFLDQTPPSSPPEASSEQKPQAIPEDPFAFLDEAPPSPASPWESPLGDRPDEPAPQRAQSSFDQGSPLDEFFAPPSTGGEQIPEDWDLTGFSPGIPAEPADEPAGPDADGAPLAGSPLSDAPPDRPSASARDTGTPAGGSYAARAPVRDTPTAPAATDGEAAREMQWFLQGAGLGDVGIPPDYAPVLMAAIGQMFRELVQGVMEVLRARSSLKSEFRMAMTTVRPVENNPLKFSVDVEEALRALLTKQGPGYLAPADAVHEGITDIKGHQMAMMAGMQAAFRELLRRFDPDAVEKAAGKGGTFGALLPAARKAKCWDLYAQQYSEVLREAEDHFQRLFGEEFARAYEEQIEQLRHTPGPES